MNCMGHTEFSCPPWEAANKNSKECYIVSVYRGEKQRGINTNSLKLPFSALVVWKDKYFKAREKSKEGAYFSRIWCGCWKGVGSTKSSEIWYRPACWHISEIVPFKKSYFPAATRRPAVNGLHLALHTGAVPLHTCRHKCPYSHLVYFVLWICTGKENRYTMFYHI